MISIITTLKTAEGICIGAGDTVDCILNNGHEYTGRIKSIEMGYIEFDNGPILPISSIDDMNLLRQVEEKGLENKQW